MTIKNIIEKEIIEESFKTKSDFLKIVSSQAKYILICLTKSVILLNRQGFYGDVKNHWYGELRNPLTTILNNKYKGKSPTEIEINSALESANTNNVLSELNNNYKKELKNNSLKAIEIDSIRQKYFSKISKFLLNNFYNENPIEEISNFIYNNLFEE